MFFLCCLVCAFYIELIISNKKWFFTTSNHKTNRSGTNSFWVGWHTFIWNCLIVISQRELSIVQLCKLSWPRDVIRRHPPWSIMPWVMPCCLTEHVLGGYNLNSLWPSEAIRRQRIESTLARVMACCLTAPRHYLNQCWLIICKVLWYS